MVDSSILSPEEFRKLVDYDPDSGRLVWKIRCPSTFTDGHRRSKEWKANNWNSARAGKNAGTLSPDGYIRINILGKQYRGHRVAWAVYHGEWPDNHLDHINGIRDDNRMSNLRITNEVGNARNACLPTTNTSGVIGVTKDKNTGKWCAYIGVKMKTVHLGSFRTMDEAIACRKGAEKVLGFSDRHGQSSRKPLPS